MPGPDEQRGEPPGTWPPTGPSATWGAGPNRSGPGWSAAVAGHGRPAIGPTDAASFAHPAAGHPVGHVFAPATPGAFPVMPAVESGAPARGGLDPAKLFGIAIAVLGALNFVFGFLPQLTSDRIDASLSVYAVGPAYVPILLVIAGLFALATFLPGSEQSRLAVAALSVGGAVGAVISLGTAGPVELLTSAQVSKGLGAALLAIFGLVQAVVAIGAYVVGADLRPRARTSTTMTPDPAGPAPVYDARFGSGSPTATAWTEQGPVWSTPWSTPPPSGPPSGPTDVPSPARGPLTPPRGTVAAPAPADPRWAQSADDDRPTGPLRIVDAAAPSPAGERGAGHGGQGPAERELPRADPHLLLKADVSATPTRSRHAADTGGWAPPGPDVKEPVTPVPGTEPSTTAPPGSPAAAAPPTVPAADPTPPAWQAESTGEAADNAPTEVYRIPPRSGDG